MRARKFIDQLRNDDIVAAIREAEQKTSGEIRVFISREKIEDAVKAAQAEFERMGMTKTRERNGVLIFVAPRACKFAVIGDSGVHKKCGGEFWQKLAEAMTGHFKKSEFNRGIILGIKTAGGLLAQYFPPRPGDRNELSDDVGGN